MTRTVRDTMVQTERQCLGLRVPCLDGRHWFCQEAEIDVQYEIVGPGGGIWHLTVRLDDGELREGTAAEPSLIVRASSEEWLALWSGHESASTTLQSRRISLLPEWRATAAPDLPRLGLLGPLQEIEFKEWHDDECADEAVCAHPWHLYPEHLLGSARFCLRDPDGFRTLRWSGASREARRLLWLIAVSLAVSDLGWLLGSSIGFGTGIALLGLGAAIATHRVKREVRERLSARCRQSPRFFSSMVDAGLIEFREKERTVQPPLEAVDELVDEAIEIVKKRLGRRPWANRQSGPSKTQARP